MDKDSKLLAEQYIKVLLERFEYQGKVDLYPYQGKTLIPAETVIDILNEYNEHIKSISGRMSDRGSAAHMIVNSVKDSILKMVSDANRREADES
jgi:hypothetical protein